MNLKEVSVSRVGPATAANAVRAAWEMVIDVVARHVGSGSVAVTAARSPQLSAVGRALISIAIQARQECGPCLVFHESAAQSVGVDDSLIQAARRGTSPDPAVATLLETALAIHASSTTITAGQIAALRNIGHSNREIADVVLVVAQNVVLGSWHVITEFHNDQAEQDLGSCGGIGIGTS